jgi:hypothetical protein
MATMTANPNPDPQKGEKKYSFKLAAPTSSDPALKDQLLNANFSQMEKDPDIKIVITVAADGTITSYNHPLTGGANKPTEERLKDETGGAPYDVGQIWDLATLTFIIYGEPAQAAQPAQGGQPAQPEKLEKAEVGFWKTVGGSRIMIS